MTALDGGAAGAFRATLEEVADAIVVVDAEGIVKYANPAAERLLGDGDGTLVGDRFGFSVSPDERTEIDLVHPRGERRIGEMRTSAIEWDGAPAHVTVIRDVTKRVATERALRDVVSTVSHEIRSPLAVVAGYVELLEELDPGSDPEAYSEHVGAIEQQIERMSALADDLLTFTRIDAGEVRAAARDVDIRALLDAVCEEFHARGVRIDVDLDGDDVVAWADDGHVRRILDNYLSNAEKYGEPPYRIEARRDGDAVVLRVLDHGPGVPEEFVGHLFERFSRAEDHRGDGSSGLGLPIVLGLARAAGGDAWYEPNERGGSAFAVRLPCPPEGDTDRG